MMIPEELEVRISGRLVLEYLVTAIVQRDSRARIPPG
jgi:hypothetical protein